MTDQPQTQKLEDESWRFYTESPMEPSEKQQIKLRKISTNILNNTEQALSPPPSSLLEQYLYYINP